jgi:hypothetical protein
MLTTPAYSLNHGQLRWFKLAVLFGTATFVFRFNKNKIHSNYGQAVSSFLGSTLRHSFQGLHHSFTQVCCGTHKERIVKHPHLSLISICHNFL